MSVTLPLFFIADPFEYSKVIIKVRFVSEWLVCHFPHLCLGKLGNRACVGRKK